MLNFIKLYSFIILCALFYVVLCVTFPHPLSSVFCLTSLLHLRKRFPDVDIIDTINCYKFFFGYFYI